MTVRHRTRNIPPDQDVSPSRGGALSRRWHILVWALALAAPLVSRARPVGTYSLIVQGPGDQTDPSIDAEYVTFASHPDGVGDWDVLLYEIGAPAGNVRVIAGGPGDQDQPCVHRTALAYRGPTGIHVDNWQTGRAWRTPDPSAAPTGRCGAADPVSQPVVSSTVAAWDCTPPGARTVVVSRYQAPSEEYEIATGGAPFGPSVSGDLIGYVDGADGSVWLHDSSPLSRSTMQVCGGNATGVSVGSFGAPVVAVARSAGQPDPNVEVWDPTGGLGTAGRIAALTVPGEQRNPHLSADWVAFEDLSTGRSQVVLWQWTTGLVFLPHPSTSNQILNDLAVVPGQEVRAVYADDGDGTGTSHDIALYQLPYVNGTIPDDGTGNPDPWAPPPPRRPAPASCDDLDAQVLGTLVLGSTNGSSRFIAPGRSDRQDDDHDGDRGDDDDQGDDQAGGRRVRDAGAISFPVVPFPGDPVLPVLICIDTQHVSAGWLTVDDAVVVDPSHLNPQLPHLEVRAVLEPGTSRLAGLLAGKPGATLQARVLADPGRFDPSAPATVTVTGRHVGGHSPSGSTPGSGPHRERNGCGTAGIPGPLAGLALLLALRLRRR